MFLLNSLSVKLANKSNKISHHKPKTLFAEGDFKGFLFFYKRSNMDSFPPKVYSSRTALCS